MKMRLLIVVVVTLVLAVVFTATDVFGQTQSKEQAKTQSKAPEKKAAAPAAATAPAPPKPGPEMQKLHFLVGTWSYTEKYAPSDFGPAGQGTGNMTCKVGPGGFSVLCDFRGVGTMGESIGHEIHTWDPKDKKYKSASVGNQWPGMMHSTGQAEGKDLVFMGTLEIGGNKLNFRTAWTDMQAKSVKFNVSFAPPGQPLKVVVTGQATKK